MSVINVTMTVTVDGSLSDNGRLPSSQQFEYAVNANDNPRYYRQEVAAAVHEAAARVIAAQRAERGVAALAGAGDQEPLTVGVAQLNGPRGGE